MKTKSYWLITASTPAGLNGLATMTSSLSVNGPIFQNKAIQKYLTEIYLEKESIEQSEVLTWNILFLIELTEDQYKVYGKKENDGKETETKEDQSK